MMVIKLFLCVYIYFFNINIIYANDIKDLEKALKQQMELDQKQKNKQLNLEMKQLNNALGTTNEKFIKKIEKEQIEEKIQPSIPKQEIANKVIQEIWPVKKLTEFEKVQQEKMNDKLNNYDSMKSFFFSTKESEVLKFSYKVFLKNQNLEKVKEKDEAITQIGNQETTTIEDKSFTIITLNSIMFMNENNWSIWLNNKKFSNIDNNNNSEFKIIFINSNQIKLKWIMTETKFKNFINKQNIISENKYSLNEEGKIEIILDLYVNQSYLSFLDKIIDGKYIPERKKKKKENLENNNLQNNNNIGNLLKDSTQSNDLDALISILMEQL